MAIVQVITVPRFVPLVTRLESGVYVAGLALPILVARQWSVPDSGTATIRKPTEAPHA